MGINCVIEKVDDIKEVVEVELENEEGGIMNRVVVQEINAVLSTEEYLGCIAKVKTVSECIGKCSKCGSVLEMNKCIKEMMAKVIISGEDGKKHTVTMFNEIISKMIGGVGGDGLSVKLLMANVHKFHINVRDVVFSVQKLTMYM